MRDPSHDDVLQFVQENNFPFVTTGDVADEFSTVSRRTIRNRLHDLVDRGDLRSRRVGPHAKVWYQLDQGSAEASSRSPSSVNQ